MRADCSVELMIKYNKQKEKMENNKMNQLEHVLSVLNKEVLDNLYDATRQSAISCIYESNFKEHEFFMKLYEKLEKAKGK